MVTPEFYNCLQWWVTHGEERNGVPTYLDGNSAHKGVWRGQGVHSTREAHEKMTESSRTPGGIPVVTTDACTDADGTDRPAMGGFLGGESYAINVPPPSGEAQAEEHIGLWEFRAGEIMITEVWHETLRNQRVLWRIDNMIAVAAVQKGYSGMASVDARLATFSERLYELGIDLWAIHIPGDWNTRADRISRNKDIARTCVYIMRPEVYADVEENLRNLKNVVTPYTGHTLDGYADATNTKCAQYCSILKPFEETPLAGHDIWLSCDFKSVWKAITHLLKEKANHPSGVRATLALPEWREADGNAPRWRPLLQKHCRLVMTIPKGSNVFLTRTVNIDLGDTQAGRLREAGPTPWNLDIWRML
jgi:hypothetical protein